MASFDFNELKEKVGEFATTAAEKAKDIASATAEQTKRLARIAKLNIEISAEKDSIKKSYIELGKLYYETHKDAPEGFFTQLCEEVSAAHAAIAEKQAELDELKAKVSEHDEPICDPDFETVVSETEAEAADGDTTSGITIECSCEITTEDENAEGESEE